MKVTDAFSPEKAAQVASWFIEAHGDRIGFYVLLKLMYLTERQSLITRGKLITYDILCLMEKGPLLSKTYDIIKTLLPMNSSSQSDPVWSLFFRRTGNFLRNTTYPGRDLLSDNELGILEEIQTRFGNMTGPELKRYTHQLPEYKNPHGSSLEIEFEEILQESGWSSEDIKACLDDLQLSAAFQLA